MHACVGYRVAQIVILFLCFTHINTHNLLLCVCLHHIVQSELNGSTNSYSDQLIYTLYTGTHNIQQDEWANLRPVRLLQQVVFAGMIDCIHSSPIHADLGSHASLQNILVIISVPGHLIISFATPTLQLIITSTGSVVTVTTTIVVIATTSTIATPPSVTSSIISIETAHAKSLCIYLFLLLPVHVIMTSINRFIIMGGIIIDKEGLPLLGESLTPWLYH